MNKQTLIRDSSQLSTWLECPEKWHNEQVEQLIHINEKNPADSNRPNDAIAAGSLGHKYLEIYYGFLGLGAEQQIAARQMLAFDPDAADTVDDDFPLDTDLRKRVRTRVSEYLMFYANRDYTPLFKCKPHVEVENNVLIDSFRREPLVEKGFSYKLLDTAEYFFVLEGRIDLISSIQNETVWVDHKFQMREHELYNKSLQFRNYSLVTNLDIGVINYVRLHKDVGPKTFVRQPITFSAYERRLWREELIDIFVKHAKYLARGEREYNWQACPGQYGYKCEFTPLCETFGSPMRESIARQQFTKRKEWRPW